MISTEVLIIGAGLSGLLLGQSLKSPSLILEKSKGVGGRVATRRIQDQGFDHGAPYLKDDFLVKELLTQFHLTSEVRSQSSGLFVERAMTRIAKAMTPGLRIEKSTRAEGILRENNHWVVSTDNGQTFSARILVLTAPLPQALQLLQKSNMTVRDELQEITYAKSVLGLVVTKDQNELKPLHSPEIRSLLAMNERSLHPRGFVIEASDETSERLFDLSDDEGLAFLLEKFNDHFSAPPVLDFAELKKWRFARPKKALPVPFEEVQENLFLIGDSFLYPDARGSILSARLLSEKLN